MTVGLFLYFIVADRSISSSNIGSEGGKSLSDFVHFIIMQSNLSTSVVRPEKASHGIQRYSGIFLSLRMCLGIR